LTLAEQDVLLVFKEKCGEKMRVMSGLEGMVDR